MAKLKKKRVVGESVDRQSKKSIGFFQILLAWIIIPLMFTTAVVLIIAKVADVNVFDQAKEWTSKVPFLEQKETDEKVEGDLILEERVISLQAEIQEKEAQLFEVQDELTQVKDSNETLVIEKEKLNEEIEKLKLAQSESTRDFKEIVTTYEQMSAKSSAPVITKMGDAEAVQILSSLKPATLASILEKMSPEDAAKYTSMLTK
ncbi:MotE family protein [Sporosarcina sp. P32b]|uniref:MotE family protein n=1 Tax=Sporosarcina sp. P32b TaxID=2048248 RepID=UPI000C16651F|nr:hypothetical protein [Sporosarcina sp. P32b]PID00164.1 hypothetical protein CSV68_04490 [Sporosarcina sp. P29]PID06847.1 hypothetical protein CSV66_02840 [Sporosarcina sp. P30]PID10042.1 hypothetical protein CSV65_02840 [Sporosarcina sp. P31]PID13620.1 hypothetical protein CSV64_00875 [Sporosarcina sp. P32b]